MVPGYSQAATGKRSLHQMKFFEQIGWDLVTSASVGLDTIVEQKMLGAKKLPLDNETTSCKALIPVHCTTTGLDPRIAKRQCVTTLQKLGCSNLTREAVLQNVNTSVTQQSIKCFVEDDGQKIAEQAPFKEVALLLEVAAQMQHGADCRGYEAATALFDLSNSTTVQHAAPLQHEPNTVKEARIVPREPMLVCDDGRQYPQRLTFKKGDILLEDYVDKYLDPKTLYVVEHILDERKHGNSRQLMVKWKGFELDPYDWTARSNLKNTVALIEWEKKKRAASNRK